MRKPSLTIAALTLASGCSAAGGDSALRLEESTSEARVDPRGEASGGAGDSSMSAGAAAGSAGSPAGEAAPPATSDYPHLVDAFNEAPNENCSSGGLRFHGGRDEDGDGLLDGDERERVTWHCFEPRCGDGRVTYGEACDAGADNGRYGSVCNRNCTGRGPHCGDGQVNGAERCDDGPSNGGFGNCNEDCSGRVFPRSCPIEDETGCGPILVPRTEIEAVDSRGARYDALVSPYFLDAREVTVARFRRFVKSYDDWRATGNPRVGAGAHPRVNGSGWSAAYTLELPANEADLRAELRGEKVRFTGDRTLATEWGVNWTDSPREKEYLPVDSVSWFVAFAFCAWDGGRLPTSAEWDVAAHGDGRVHPWGDAWAVPPIGSDELSSDVGPLEHEDLGYGVLEWVLDEHGSLPSPCRDCARTSLPEGVEFGQLSGRDARRPWISRSGASVLLTAEVSRTTRQLRGAGAGTPYDGHHAADFGLAGLRCAYDLGF